MRWLLFGLLVILCMVQVGCVETVKQPEAKPLITKNVTPYRTFITIQRYNMENNGEINNPISNVRLELGFPNGSKLQLPEGGNYWPIGNGQVKEINRTYELPFAYVVNDGFKMKIQMVRKGSDMLPCEFQVSSLSEFNRGYTCHTDLGWQTNERIAPERMDKEGIQVRIFTDKAARPGDIPNDSLALR